VIEYVWAQDPWLAVQHVERATTDPSAEVIHLRAEPSEVPGLVEAMSAPSLFAPQRVVVVRDGERLSAKGVAWLGETLRGPNVADLLVVIAVADRIPSALTKTMQAVGKVHRLERPKRGELVAWVQRRLQSAGLKPAKDVAPTLIELVGGASLGDLAGAIDQLALRKPGSQIARDDVLKQFGRTAEQPVWALFDALLAHDRPRSFGVLEQLLDQGEDAMAILFALVSQVRYLLKARSAIERGAAGSDSQLASALGVSPGRAGVLRRQASRASWEWLLHCHSLFAQADVDLKGGETFGRYEGTALPPRIVLERVVAAVIEGAERTPSPALR